MEWVGSGPGYIVTNYSAPNNHILHTFLMWISTSVFGESELAIRLPALLGFALLCVGLAFLVRAVMQHPIAQLLAYAGIVLHPFVIDFGACARGYTLCAAFLVGAAVLIHQSNARPKWLVAASSLMTLAMLTIPIAIDVVIPMCIGAAFLLRSTLRERAVVLAYLSVPAALVSAAVYIPLLQQTSADTFWFGASTPLESLQSLREVLVYRPESRVDMLGVPVQAWPTRPWQSGPLPSFFNNLIEHPLGVLPVVFMLLCVPLGFIYLEKMTTLAKLGLIVVIGALLVMALRHYVLGLKFPLGRTWFLLVPFMLTGFMVLIDGLQKRRLQYVAFGLAAILILHGCGRIRLHAYREWPDNAVVPQALDLVTPGVEVTIGYPWYMASSFAYYQEQKQLTWLRLPPTNLEQSERTDLDFVLVNLRQYTAKPAVYDQLVPVHSFREHGLVLYEQPN